jgi:hypothetical protein
VQDLFLVCQAQLMSRPLPCLLGSSLIGTRLLSRRENSFLEFLEVTIITFLSSSVSWSCQQLSKHHTTLMSLSRLQRRAKILLPISMPRMQRTLGERWRHWGTPRVQRTSSQTTHLCVTWSVRGQWRMQREEILIDLVSKTTHPMNLMFL